MSKTIFEEMEIVLDGIAKNKKVAEDANGKNITIMDVVLKTATEGQAQGFTVQQQKVALFKKRGYRYKDYNPIENKMVTWDGEKAPGFISTLFSQATKGEVMFGDLGQFKTWGEMLKRCKSEDILASLKKVEQVGHKSLKKTKVNQQGWIDWYKGEIEILNAKLEREALAGIQLVAAE